MTEWRETWAAVYPHATASVSMARRFAACSSTAIGLKLCGELAWTALGTSCDRRREFATFLAGFAYFAPWVYALPLDADQHAARRWLKRWD